MEKIGKYEVLEKIGTGGFGVVFKGRDPFIKRHVAIKTCNSDDEDMRRRFCREAEIAGNLQHKNVTTVYDFGYHGDVPYLVQEYLPGEDLDKLIEQRVLSPATKLDYLVQIAAGLEYAHSQGVIHRDIKPSNVRVVDGVRVKIMDFGIAKLANQDSQLTKTGMTLGTASYLSPEQIRGEELTAAVDIFAFGVLAYELFAHRRPFIGASLSNLFYQILSAEVPPLRTYAPECPPALAAVIERCLHKEPAGRWASCADLLAALEGVREELGVAPDDPAEATARLSVAPAPPDELGATVLLTQSRAKQELAAIQARIEELLAAGDPTAAEIEISLARQRFVGVPGAAATLDPLQRRANEARDRQEEGRRRGEKLAALLTRGRTLATAGEHQEAALVLRTALELDPNSPDAQRLLSDVQEKAALAARRQALVDGARAVAAQIDSGEVTAAAAALERLVRDHGEDPELSRLRGVVEQRRRRARAVELRREAERQAEAGDLSQALEVLREGLALAPEDTELATLLAAVEGRRAERRAAAERAATVEAARQGIEVALTRGELDAAETALAAAQRSLGESFGDLRERLAEARAAQRRARVAEEVAAGDAALSRGDLAAATAAARRAQGLDPSDGALAGLLARVAAAEERQRAAAEAERLRLAEEERVRAAAEQRRLEEERARAEEERRLLAEQERQRAEEERQRAEEERRRAEEERQRRVAGLLAAAGAALDGGDVAAAAAAAGEARALAPDAPGLADVLSRVAAEEERLRAEEEERRRREAEEERRRQAEAAAVAAAGALERGDLAGAEAAARRLESLAPDDERARDLLGRVAAETDRRRAEEEERRRRQAEEDRQRQIAALVGGVAALVAAGKLRKARKELDRGSAALGDDPALVAAAERLQAAEAEAAAAGTAERGAPWRWIAAAGVGVVVIGTAAAVWSGGAGSSVPPAVTAPTVARAQPVPVSLPTVAPAVAEQEMPMAPLPEAATAPSPGALEGMTDPAAEQLRLLVAQGRTALSRGDQRGALAVARDAWASASADPEVVRLVADLTRAGDAAAERAEREARAANAQELAADLFRSAESRRRQASSGGPGGAAALWDSVPLYGKAAEAARAEHGRRERQRQADVAAQRERERQEELARQREAQPRPQPRPAEPRPAEPQSPPAERPAPRDETAQVREAVERYGRAYQALDAAEVAAVWPGVDVGRLTEAYRQLKSASVRVIDCKASGATGSCRVEQRVVPQAGSAHASTVEVRLRKTAAGWVIEGMRAL